MNRCLIALGLLCATATAPSIAAAEGESAEISVNPGLWNWSQRTVLVSFPIEEENTECLPESDANFSLQRLADDLDQNCSISDVEQSGNEYDFTLSCDGIYAGSATGTFTKISDEHVELKGAGKVELLGEVGNFTIEAKAVRVGACPASENG